MKKILLFLKQHSLLVLLVSLSVLFSILFFLPIFPKKLSTTVLKKLDDTVNKTKEEIQTVKVKEAEIQVIKETAKEEIQTKKEEFQTKLEEIKKIPDNRKKLKELILFRDSIKKFK